MKVAFLFAWYDLWVGLFWDKKKKWLYFFPIPCFGMIFKFNKVKLTLLSKEEVEKDRSSAYDYIL